ncbi:MAG TPA: ribosome biogenesis GTPase Der [Anaerolineae bacterium]|nr:ribosome biogenesis GTPase Der [Anaerolineae bacterium]
MNSKPILAIVGRPNVGKSTLFNRLIGERLAIVAEVAGTTRDRLYADAEFAGREFTVVDTGGIVGEREAVAENDTAAFFRLSREQAELAIAEADAILFLTDAEAGVLPDDYEIAEILRRSEKPVYLAVNKADNPKRVAEAVEFYQLGLGEPYPISGLHGAGIGDLLQIIVEHFPPAEPETETEIPQIAIVGRPNVGKSSLLNAILGQERAIVSEIPGTTRDAIDTQVIWRNQPLTLIDTAGIRRRGKIEPGIEKFSSLRALKAIQRADVVLLVLDAIDGPTSQDMHVASYALEENKGIVLVVNKWDAIEKETNTMDEYTQRVRAAFNFIPYAPIVFTSAKYRQRIPAVVDTALRVRQELRVRIPTTDLNEILREAVAQHSPPTKGKRSLKFYYATQVGIIPPTFVFFVNHKDLVHFSYERYLENQIREHFKLTGAPIKMIFRAHSQKENQQ